MNLWSWQISSSFERWSLTVSTLFLFFLHVPCGEQLLCRLALQEELKEGVLGLYFNGFPTVSYVWPVCVVGSLHDGLPANHIPFLQGREGGLEAVLHGLLQWRWLVQHKQLALGVPPAEVEDFFFNVAGLAEEVLWGNRTGLLRNLKWKCRRQRKINCYIYFHGKTSFSVR